MRSYWVAIAILFTANGEVFGQDYTDEYPAHSEDPLRTAIEWLPQIDRITVTGRYIDIALSREGQNELCYFITPNGDTEQSNIEGVIMQNSSNIVSCRITIGPMENSLLGIWTLCGQYEEQIRCQQVNITWLNANNPGSAWSVNQNTQFNHSVSLRGYLGPTVTGSGTIRSCHVITPYGEDLVITATLQYPGIHFVPLTSTSACSISIGPIERWMLGEWTLYGLFRAKVTTEARLSMNLALYDEDNPYGQPYNVTDLNTINRITNFGSNVTLEVTGSGNIDSCQYRAPNALVYQFNGTSQYYGVTIPDIGNIVACRILVGPLEKNMFGEWEIIGKFSNNGIFTERRQPFNVVERAEGEFPEVDTEWLPHIDRITVIGQHIDIALHNIKQNEHCYFQNPTGGEGDTQNGMYGVTVHDSTEFVACRITVGPMEASLLGNWTLCARHGDQNQYRRCQSANITWLNANNPSSAWTVTRRTQFNYSVSLDRYLRPTVNGSGTTRSCHVITPYGEDLVINATSRYPGIQFEAVTTTATCAVSIGPIERWMLGEWTLYGLFRAKVTTEVRLPMNLALYDEENPFDDPYNITNLIPINRITNLGTNTTVEVASSGNVDSCVYRAPDGFTYKFDDTSLIFYGVTIPDVGNEIVCRMVIGPIEETMLGDWEIIGKFSNNDIFTELRQPFTLIRGAGEEFPKVEIEWLPQVDRVTSIGQFVDIALHDIGQNEICSFENPSGGQGNEQIEMHGVNIHPSSNFVSCRITVGPMVAAHIGNWTLCGRHGENNEYKRCQRVNIAWVNANNATATWSLTQRAEFNHSVSIGGFLRPTVTGAGSVRSCHVVTPNGEDLMITSDSRYPGIQLEPTSSSTICSVSIGPIERWMLGEWTVYGFFMRSVLLQFRQPMHLSLFDESNPYEQPYNVTNLNSFNRIINLGINTTVEVTGSGNLDSCHYIAPNGDTYDFDTYYSHFSGVTIPNVGNTIVCRMELGPIKEIMLGEWEIIGRFSNNGIFTERRQPFNLVLEDPENPITEDRVIQNVTGRHIETHIGAIERVTIARVRNIEPETCHIRTPAGRQYIMSEHFNLLGVTPLVASDIECGVSIEVLSEDMVGEWILISRALSSSVPVERRMHFDIYVEEHVEAFPQDVTITENNNLYVRLRNPTDLYESCTLVGPRGSNNLNDIVASHTESCGFIVSTIQMSDQGTWEIVYGTKIIYKASVNVTVIERIASFVEDLILIKDEKVNKEVGPEDVVYCRLEDPTGLVVFDNFGRCQLTIERVTMEHDGHWKILIASPGRVLLEEFDFMVTVTESEPKIVVTTNVQRQQPSVVLSCSVSSAHNVSACKFRDPKGNILIAAQGVGEDRYSFLGSEVSYESNVTSHKCGIRINYPSEDDLGLWRCAIETERKTHYGFLSVICPWLMQDPDVQASVVTDPTLTADRSKILAIEGEGVTMSCSIEAPIRYCYFRASNGTVFSITPETSSPLMEFVGGGFDAGECGIRFKGLMANDSGNWSCNVGLYHQAEEHRAQTQITILEPITVRHYWHEAHGLVAEAFVHSERSLDYCRFVRIDGLGFTTDSIPDGYRFIGSLAGGHCLLQIREPNMLNLHPWTIVARIRGQGVELFRQTTDNLLWFESNIGYFPIYLWFVIALIALLILLLGSLFGVNKSRKWMYGRATQFRTSIRNSFRKGKGAQTP